MTAPLSAVAEASLAEENPEEQELALELRRLGRHLIEAEVTPYQIGKYLDFHRKRPLVPRNAFDRFLLQLSRKGAFGLRLADAYSGTLYRVCIVRMKLVLTLAILECSPPSFVLLDRPEPGGRWVLARMALRVVVALLWLLASIALIAPVHVWFAATSRTNK